MPLHPDFPRDPYVILEPEIRWYPGDDQFGELGLMHLLPPLVHKIRHEVKAWRDLGYLGASRTTRALLRWWFQVEHIIAQADGTASRFRWYFAQREAVESAIWLFEVAKARDPHSLMRFDSSGAVSRNMFLADWTRYVLKLATGAGKTKVMSLLMTWSYFHKLYEPESELSTNFLVVAPNIIVLDRLRLDFEGARVFFDDPLLPDNGHEGQNWQDDFQLTVHIQDEIGHVGKQGNLFLSNIHRVFEGQTEAPSFDDEDTTDYFLGPKPVTKTTDSLVDLSQIVREVDDLVVLNDEAHHIHEENAWFRAIEDIALKLRQKGRALSAQFDLSATPKHGNGAIFVETVSDYPLVEAIRQGVVKTPVVPDDASRARLNIRQSSEFVERFRDYLHLGYLEWKKSFDELSRVGKKPVMFVMTDDTRNCDAVSDHLQKTYREFAGGTLVIHTKRNGDISESATAQTQKELQKLRAESREIDLPENPTKAIVSVMMLREGWDVQNVTAIVGLRAYSTDAGILPEQTIGRGLRRMFRGADVQEKVSVVGTPKFMEFVESIRNEGVELEVRPMGERAPAFGPMVVEVDRDNPDKNIDRLDVELPVMKARLEREYKNVGQIDPMTMPSRTFALRTFSEEEQRDIVFKQVDDESFSHVTRLDGDIAPTPQNVIGFFVNAIRRDARLVSGFDILYGKLKAFVGERLFGRHVDLEDRNVLRNLSIPEVTQAIRDAFRNAINALIVVDRGDARIQTTRKLSAVGPTMVARQDEYRPKKSVFNRVVGDSSLELDFAASLDQFPDVASFARNSARIAFKIEYQATDGRIADYFPDFIVKTGYREVWIVETKGRIDIEDAPKWRRLVQWCEDATNAGKVVYRPLFVPEAEWKTSRFASFAEAAAAFGGRHP
ncbi:MAG TPA: DEAD/DEAH box helicase family protein [Roseiarcus sp.]|nr:DEAD/DEAH box helicase family protein [Roseiarcus sp.]